MDPIAQRVLSLYDQLERDSLDLHTMFEFVGGNDPKQREAVLDAVSELVKSGFAPRGRERFLCTDGRRAAGDRQSARNYPLHARGLHAVRRSARCHHAARCKNLARRLREVDIDDDPILHDRYTNDVPVIFLGSRIGCATSGECDAVATPSRTGPQVASNSAHSHFKYSQHPKFGIVPNSYRNFTRPKNLFSFRESNSLPARTKL